MTTKNMRNVGVGFIGLGLLVMLTYFVEPLQMIYHAFRQLPGLMQFGLGAALLGSLITIVSLISERFADREADAALRDDDTPQITP